MLQLSNGFQLFKSLPRKPELISEKSTELGDSSWKATSKTDTGLGCSKTSLRNFKVFPIMPSLVMLLIVLLGLTEGLCIEAYKREITSYFKPKSFL